MSQSNLRSPLNELLSAVSARLEAAHKRPWRVQCTPKGPCGQMVYADAVLGPVKYPTSDPAKFVDVEQSIIWIDQRAVPRWRETLGFIANAPDDIARLVEIVKVLRDVLADISVHNMISIDKVYLIHQLEGYVAGASEALQRADELAK